MPHYMITLDEGKESVENHQALQGIMQAFGQSALGIADVTPNGLLVDVKSESTLPQLLDKVSDIATIYEVASPLKKRPALRVIEGGRKP